MISPEVLTDSPSAMRMRRRRASALGKRASGAIVTQFLNAGGSLILQAIAARVLGADGYGGFAICLSCLLVATAFHTGFVGDAFTVFDRQDPRLRGALTTAMYASTFTAATVATITVASLVDIGAGGAALYFLCVSLWLLEESGRRVLAARLEFWQLVANDGTYVAASLGAVVVLRLVLGEFTLNLLLGSIAIGAATAIVVALAQLPRDERLFRRPSRAGFIEIWRFSAYRAFQISLRPLSMLLVRVMVLILVSQAAVGNLEAARLLMAPAITLVSGVGIFMVSFFAHSFRHRHRVPSELLLTVVVVGGVGAYVALALVFRAPLESLVNQRGIHVSSVALLAWGSFAAAFAAGLVAESSLVARKATKSLFRVRMIETIASLGLAWFLLANWGANAAVFGLAAGMTCGALWLLRLVAKTPIGSSIEAALAWDQAGSGRPLLLVNGGMGDRRVWDRCASRWTRERVVRVDPRGFGDTPLPDTPYKEGADLIELVDGLALKDTIVVASGLAARAALELASTRGPMMAGVILVSPLVLDGHGWSPDVIKFSTLECEALEAGDLDRAVELNLAMWLDGPGHGPRDVGVRHALARMQRDAFLLHEGSEGNGASEPTVPDLMDRLGELQVPVRVVIGEFAAADFRAIAERLTARIPGASLGVIAGTAAMVQMERPEALVRLVEELRAQGRPVDAEQPIDAAGRGRIAATGVSSGTADTTDAS